MDEFDDFPEFDFEEPEESTPDEKPLAYLKGGTLREIMIQLVEHSEGINYFDLKHQLRAVRTHLFENTLHTLLEENQLIEVEGQYFSLPPDIIHLNPLKA